MLLTVLLTLVCAACASLAHREQGVSDSLPGANATTVLDLSAALEEPSSNPRSAAPDALTSLAHVLLALNPAAAFKPTSALARRSLEAHSSSSPARGVTSPIMTATAPVDTTAIKSQMLQIAALTDRGQRLNKLIAPAYQEKREEMAACVERLIANAAGKAVSEAQLAGDWELVYSDVELFRSSPFFLAIEEALNGSPGIPALGRWLGLTDPKKKAELFFKLHQLQVMSWGVSTVGRIGQTLDFKGGKLESSFDTTIFGLTVIPIIGWFKLLPTFGGRVVTEADQLKLTEDGTVTMELQRTQVITAPGVPRLPLLDGIFMDRWYPVNPVWKFLPWNEGRAPTCSIKVEYVDEQMRISRDAAGALFVYTRPIVSEVPEARRSTEPSA